MADVISGLGVVIPFYGDPAPTLHLITQLQQQQGAPELQVIVADDCSPTPFPQGSGYEVVRREVNGGFGANVNAGMERVRHDHALILNSDVQLEPDTVARWCSQSRTWLPAVTGPAQRGASGHVACTARRFPSPRHHVVEWLRLLARWRGREWHQRLIGEDPRALHSTQPIMVDWLVGSALLVPVEEFRAIGGFDERFFMNAEEVDLQRRLREERGIPAVYLPDVLVQHTGGGSSDPAKRLGWVVDARFRYFRKWGGERRLYCGLWAATLANVVFNALRTLVGRDGEAWEAFRRERDVIQHAWKERG